MEKVLIGTSSFASIDPTPKENLINAGFEIINNPFGRRLNKEELLNLLPGIKGIIAGLEPFDRDVLEKSDLKVVSRCGSGVSNVDFKAAEELGIKVFSTPNAPVTAVAELTIGALLSLLRFIHPMNSALHEHKWDKRIGAQLEGRRVAIIGFGRIGQRVAKLLKAFGAQIVAVDPGYSEQQVDEVPIVSMDEALSKSDVVTLHASGTDVILGKEEFKVMKKGSFLLNAARGELVEEEALIDALDSGILTGAWLDTFKQEPYSGKLCNFKQVILTPHIGSYTAECRSAMETEAVNNLITGFQKND